MRTDGGTFRGLACFIGDFHSKKAGGARTGNVYGAFSVDHLNLQNGELCFRRASQRYRQRRREAQSGDVHLEPSSYAPEYR